MRASTRPHSSSSSVPTSPSAPGSATRAPIWCRRRSASSVHSCAPTSDSERAARLRETRTSRSSGRAGRTATGERTVRRPPGLLGRRSDSGVTTTLLRPPRHRPIMAHDQGVCLVAAGPRSRAGGRRRRSPRGTVARLTPPGERCSVRAAAPRRPGERSPGRIGHTARRADVTYVSNLPVIAPKRSIPTVTPTHSRPPDPPRARCRQVDAVDHDRTEDQVRRVATRDRSTAGAPAALGVLLLAVLFLLAVPGTARAAVAGCVADAATGCINGTIRTADQQPAVGVVLDVEGPGGTTQATTDAEGRWTAAVTEAGTYTVTLDEATLPAGESLRDPAQNPRTVTVALGSSAGALFPLGAPADTGGNGSDEDPDAAPDPESTAPADTAGEVGAPVGSSDTGSFSWGRLAQQASSGLVFGVLLALASVGLSLIYGTTGLSNFAHGEQVTLGAIVAYLAVQSFGLPLLVAGVVAVLVGAAYFLLGTRVGRATRAVSDNPALAAASGITVDRIVRLVWVLGAALAALGGVLMGLYLNATSWNMGGALLLLMFAAVTLGGLGQAFGALAGSIVIGLVVEMSNLVIPSDMRYAGALLILILVLLLRPQGILGRAERIG